MPETVEKIEGRIPTRAELTRERILEAAEVVFAKHGLNGTRIREIAQTAGVNNATIYSYFPSKIELHEAVLERGMQPLVDLMMEFSTRPNDMEAAGRLLRGAMKHLSERPNLSRLIYLEIISEGEIPACGESIILISDGNHTEATDPTDAIPALQERGIKVYEDVFLAALDYAIVDGQHCSHPDVNLSTLCSAVIPQYGVADVDDRVVGTVNSSAPGGGRVVDNCVVRDGRVRV